MELLGYTVSNYDKFHRAIYGSVGKEGKLYGGVGEDASDLEKLAAYDKTGGLILKGKAKVKTGSFYDFENKKPREEAEVLLIFKDIEGNTVELTEGEAKPVEVIAAEKIAEKKLDKAKKEYAKKGKKEDDEDE